jgi:hypothetical protein
MAGSTGRSRQGRSKLPWQLDADQRRKAWIVPRVRDARAGDDVVGISASASPLSVGLPNRAHDLLIDAIQLSLPLK